VTFDQFQQNVEPFLWAETSVKLIVGFVRLLKAAEDLNNAIHRITLTRALMTSVRIKRKKSALHRFVWLTSLV
jgi:hypothetical protein